MSFRLPFTFDRYFVTATFDDDDASRDRRAGRGETAWRLLDSGGEVRLEVRVPDDGCVLRFDDGRFRGCSDHGTDAERERDRFLAACARQLENPEDDPHVAVSGPARRVLSRLLERCA